MARRLACGRSFLRGNFLKEVSPYPFKNFEKPAGSTCGREGRVLARRITLRLCAVFALPRCLQAGYGEAISIRQALPPPFSAPNGVWRKRPHTALHRPRRVGAAGGEKLRRLRWFSSPARGRPNGVTQCKHSAQSARRCASCAKKKLARRHVCGPFKVLEGAWGNFFQEVSPQKPRPQVKPASGGVCYFSSSLVMEGRRMTSS